MRLNRILLTTAALLILAVVATAAPLPAPGQAGAPSLDAFLSTLNAPAAGTAATPVNRSGCGPNFCTQAQRDACTQQCLSHGHGPFVGLECCSNCTTLCICGSVPVDC